MENQAEITKERIGSNRGKTPVGYRRVHTERGWETEPDPDKVFALKLAFALAETGKLSVREISAEVAKYGLVGQDGEPLLPATLWRVLRSTH